MEVKYVENGNYYRVDVAIQKEGVPFEFPAVLDTGASNTTLSLDMLINEKPSDDLIKQLDELAQRTGVKPRFSHGVTAKKGVEEAYTYPACFKNVIIGGHFMEKFHVNIMVNGADDIFIIGNDFLNMCNYQHKAGEKALVVENPNAQKYYESFEQRSELDDGRLHMLLFHFERDGKFSDETLDNCL